MPKVTYNETEYTCSKAIKGEDYIRLLDADCICIASFVGITDFSAFTITNGTWTPAPSEDELPVAVVAEDGTVIPSSRKCLELVTGGALSFAIELLPVSTSTGSYETYTNGNNAIVEIDLPEVINTDIYKYIELEFIDFGSYTDASVGRYGFVSLKDSTQNHTTEFAMLVATSSDGLDNEGDRKTAITRVDAIIDAVQSMHFSGWLIGAFQTQSYAEDCELVHGRKFDKVVLELKSTSNIVQSSGLVLKIKAMPLHSI